MMADKNAELEELRRRLEMAGAKGAVKEDSDATTVGKAKSVSCLCPRVAPLPFGQQVGGPDKRDLVSEGEREVSRCERLLLEALQRLEEVAAAAEGRQPRQGMFESGQAGGDTGVDQAFLDKEPGADEDEDADVVAPMVRRKTVDMCAMDPCEEECDTSCFSPCSGAYLYDTDAEGRFSQLRDPCHPDCRGPCVGRASSVIRPPSGRPSRGRSSCSDPRRPSVPAVRPCGVDCGADSGPPPCRPFGGGGGGGAPSQLTPQPVTQCYFALIGSETQRDPRAQGQLRQQQILQIHKQGPVRKLSQLAQWERRLAEVRASQVQAVRTELLTSESEDSDDDDDDFDDACDEEGGTSSDGGVWRLRSVSRAIAVVRTPERIPHLRELIGTTPAPPRDHVERVYYYYSGQGSGSGEGAGQRGEGEEAGAGEEECACDPRAALVNAHAQLEAAQHDLDLARRRIEMLQITVDECRRLLADPERPLPCPAGEICMQPDICSPMRTAARGECAFGAPAPSAAQPPATQSKPESPISKSSEPHQDQPPQVCPGTDTCRGQEVCPIFLECQEEESTYTIGQECPDPKVCQDTKLKVAGEKKSPTTQKSETGKDQHSVCPGDDVCKGEEVCPIFMECQESKYTINEECPGPDVCLEEEGEKKSSTIQKGRTCKDQPVVCPGDDVCQGEGVCPVSTECQEDEPVKPKDDAGKDQTKVDAVEKARSSLVCVVDLCPGEGVCQGPAVCPKSPLPKKAEGQPAEASDAVNKSSEVCPGDVVCRGSGVCPVPRVCKEDEDEGEAPSKAVPTAAADTTVSAASGTSAASSAAAGPAAAPAAPTDAVPAADAAAASAPDVCPDAVPEAAAAPSAAAGAPDTVPDAAPDTADTAPDAAPDTAPSTVPGTVPDTAPGAPDTAPDTTPDTAASTAPGTVPGAPDTAPDATPDTAPDTVPGTAPDTAPDTALDTVPGTVPGTAPDTVPGTIPDTAPDAAPDTTSEAAVAAAPDAAPDVASSSTPGVVSIAAPAEEYAQVDVSDEKPVSADAGQGPQESTAPVGDAATPSAQESTAPIQEAARPSAQESTAPVQQATRPSAQESTAPVRQAARPSAQKSTAPKSTVRQAARPSAQERWKSVRASARPSGQPCSDDCYATGPPPCVECRDLLEGGVGPAVGFAAGPEGAGGISDELEAWARERLAETEDLPDRVRALREKAMGSGGGAPADTAPTAAPTATPTASSARAADVAPSQEDTPGTKSEPIEAKPSAKSEEEEMKPSEKSLPTEVKSSVKSQLTEEKSSVKSQLTEEKSSVKSQLTEVKPSEKSQPTEVKSVVESEPIQVKTGPQEEGPVSKQTQQYSVESCYPCCEEHEEIQGRTDRSLTPRGPGHQPGPAAGPASVSEHSPIPTSVSAPGLTPGISPGPSAHSEDKSCHPRSAPVPGVKDAKDSSEYETSPEGDISDASKRDPAAEARGSKATRPAEAAAAEEAAAEPYEVETLRAQAAEAQREAAEMAEDRAAQAQRIEMLEQERSDLHSRIAELAVEAGRVEALEMELMSLRLDEDVHVRRLEEAQTMEVALLDMVDRLALAEDAAAEAGDLRARVQDLEAALEDERALAEERATEAGAGDQRALQEERDRLLRLKLELECALADQEDEIRRLTSALDRVAASAAGRQVISSIKRQVFLRVSGYPRTTRCNNEVMKGDRPPSIKPCAQPPDELTQTQKLQQQLSELHNQLQQQLQQMQEEAQAHAQKEQELAAAIFAQQEHAAELRQELAKAKKQSQELQGHLGGRNAADISDDSYRHSVEEDPGRMGCMEQQLLEESSCVKQLTAALEREQLRFQVNQKREAEWLQVMRQQLGQAAAAARNAQHQQNLPPTAQQPCYQTPCPAKKYAHTDLPPQNSSPEEPPQCQPIPRTPSPQLLRPCPRQQKPKIICPTQHLIQPQQPVPPPESTIQVPVPNCHQIRAAKSRSTHGPLRTQAVAISQYQAQQRGRNWPPIGDPRLMKSAPSCPLRSHYPTLQQHRSQSQRPRRRKLTCEVRIRLPRMPVQVQRPRRNYDQVLSTAPQQKYLSVAQACHLPCVPSLSTAVVEERVHLQRMNWRMQRVKSEHFISRCTEKWCPTNKQRTMSCSRPLL